MNSRSPEGERTLPVNRVLLPFITLSLPCAAQAMTSGYTPVPGDYVFYTFALCGMAFSAAIITAYREFRWLVYVLLSLLLLCSAASMDGTLAYLLGESDFVLWVVPYLLTSASAAFGFLVIMLRLEDPHPLARLRHVFLALALVSAAMPLTSVIWLHRIPLSTMWVPVNVLFFGMVLAQVLPPLTWHTPDPLQRLLTRVLPVVVGFLAAGLYLFHYASAGFSQPELNAVNRLLLLLFAGFSLAIVIWQVVANTREKAAAERRALEAARMEAEVQLALAQAEQNYEAALSAASRHRSRLATVSHDLKQPISALRLAVDQMQRHGRAEGADKLARAVDYIASLAHTYIDEGTGTEATDDLENPASGGQEVVGARVFAQALQQMFAGQAERQGVRFRVFCPEYSVRVEPLATMRIMTNLVSNALAHAAPGRLVIGFRAGGDSIVFQVHDDGCGMDGETLASVRQQGVRGEASEGHGLGLGIVHELCEAQGMPFTLNSTPGRGTSACVALPRADRSAESA